jgi:hypothetical protein
MTGNYIFFGIMVILGIYLIVDAVRTAMLFQKDENPYRRTCKKCGARQVMYQSNVEGVETREWWQEHDEGNNPDCRCHRKVENNRWY